jgi:hypothetical protein
MVRIIEKDGEIIIVTNAEYDQMTIDRLLDSIVGKFPRGKNYQPCKKCGNPTKGTICHKCSSRSQL